MVRDIWVVLLFLGGLMLGVLLGFVYHQTASAALSRTIAAKDEEIDRLDLALVAEQQRSKASVAQAEESKIKLQRELELVQLQLAEQTELVARQRERLAELARQIGSEPAADLDLPASSKKESGLINGGDFVYRRLKLQRHEDELEVSGEMENRTKKQFDGAYFHIEFFNEQHDLMETKAIAITKFLPGEIRPFKEYAITDPNLLPSIDSYRVTLALLREEND